MIRASCVGKKFGKRGSGSALSRSTPRVQNGAPKAPARITLAEFRAALMAKKRNKYGNVPTVGVDGKRKASKAEAGRDGDLALLERADKIHALERQPRYPLYVGGKLICIYIGDWRYRDGPAREHNAQLVVEDKKGALTKDFKIKWALAKALYPEIEWRLS